MKDVQNDLITQLWHLEDALVKEGFQPVAIYLGREIAREAFGNNRIAYITLMSGKVSVFIWESNAVGMSADRVLF